MNCGESVARFARRVPGIPYYGWVAQRGADPSMWTFFSILGVGFVLGMRHATDPDHVVAVTTIVSRERSTANAAVIGAFWGLGHTATIFVVGTGIILFDIVIPVRLGLSMELCVGFMLIALGIWNLVTFQRSVVVVPAENVEGITLTHSHAHSHRGVVHSHSHTHVGEAGLSLPKAVAPRHPDSRYRKGLVRFGRPLVVGVIHGLAGSAAVALLILASIRNSKLAIVYLLVFGVGTIAGMVLISTGIATSLGFAGDRAERFSQRLGLVTGMISVAFGCFMAYRICVVQGLFSSHPSWIPS